ncbi:hypothetical protein [Maridesulfovibrio hydrothermalis]|uniref:Uncharacterized protein n=1 Tax=Maridesulfovibrio hydrothermalis AM13 = DSM 14728 TaxID=1121451 RepID=L0R9S1_9BACT|nr:hypothetical protein [Maridesulfovibrio hydrothermalis]CCO22957.1 conserved protein of unknown function [Maridesulfovibrio hydrothermalis AM13 = DSM 14728]
MKKSAALKRVTLENDFGGQISFTGKLDNETLNYNEGSGELVSEKIYMTEQGRTGYSVVTGDGFKRERRAYLLEDQGETCMVSNGSILLGLETDNMLTFFAAALAEQAESLSENELEYVKKQLKVVNG